MFDTDISTPATQVQEEHRAEPGNPCLICRKKDPEKATIFRGTNWCSENHRKLIWET